MLPNLSMSGLLALEPPYFASPSPFGPLAFLSENGCKDRQKIRICLNFLSFSSFCSLLAAFPPFFPVPEAAYLFSSPPSGARPPHRRPSRAGCRPECLFETTTRGRGVPWNALHGVFMLRIGERGTASVTRKRFLNGAAFGEGEIAKRPSHFVGTLPCRDADFLLFSHSSPFATPISCSGCAWQQPLWACARPSKDNFYRVVQANLRSMGL